MNIGNKIEERKKGGKWGERKRDEGTQKEWMSRNSLHTCCRRMQNTNS